MQNVVVITWKKVQFSAQVVSVVVNWWIVDSFHACLENYYVV